MQETAASTPAPISPSFAGLLAALASPPQKSTAPSGTSAPLERNSSLAWNDDGLEDDVATLSYERALRTHARYRSSAPTDQSLTQPAEPEPILLQKTSPASPPSISQPATHPAANPVLESDTRSALFDKNLKDASITIRMSKAECAQLHRRAAEAGLTVSAYLRSCTFEADSLRAMVKDTLAQLRSAAGQAAPATPHRSWLGSRLGNIRK
jgi:hypothetical protein